MSLGGAALIMFDLWAYGDPSATLWVNPYSTWGPLIDQVR